MIEDEGSGTTSRASAGARGRVSASVGLRPGTIATLGGVIAVIFHWWLGLLLVLGGGAATVALVGAYLKTVTAAKYPNGKQKRED